MSVPIGFVVRITVGIAVSIGADTFGGIPIVW